MTGRAIPERIEFALELVAAKPGETILEAGGGPGVAAELICNAVAPSGSMTMIDRSAVAVKRAVARNKSAVEAGLLTVEASELAKIPDGSFDAFFCVDLNAFWTNGGLDEIAAIERALRPGGRAAIVYGVGPSGPHGEARLKSIALNLGTAGFGSVAVVRESRGGAITAIRE